MGSASLFFSLAPDNAILADVNADLVATFVAVKKHPRRVRAALAKMSRDESSYYRIRSLNVDDLSQIQRAARFIFLNRFCFNGLYRTNTAGRFNVPYSPVGTGNLPTLKELELASSALKHATIRSGDFGEVLRDVQKGDFVYLDPPYAVANRRVFRQYGPSSFGIDDLTRLAKGLREIDSRGGRFVLSYAHCSEALHYLGEWNTRRVTIQRNISGFAKHRRRAAEIIVSNITGLS